MKRFLLLLLLLCSLPSWATWTVVQHKISGACTASSSTCAVTVTSTGTGNVIVIGMAIASNVEAIVSVSGGGTYSHPAGCNGTSGSTFGTDCAYTLASTSGTTSITVTRTDATTHTWRVAATELSFTSGPVSVDSGSPQTRTQTTAVTNPAGVTLTLTGSNDAIYQMILSTTPSAITSPYSTNVDFSGPGGFAVSINTVSGTAPTWTTASSAAALSAIAFTETAASGCSNLIALMGAGCK